MVMVAGVTVRVIITLCYVVTRTYQLPVFLPFDQGELRHDSINHVELRPVTRSASPGELWLPVEHLAAVLTAEPMELWRDAIGTGFVALRAKEQQIAGDLCPGHT